MKNLFLLFIVSAFIFSCQQDEIEEQIVQEENQSKLYDPVQGRKYWVGYGYDLITDIQREPALDISDEHVTRSFNPRRGTTVDVNIISNKEDITKTLAKMDEVNFGVNEIPVTAGGVSGTFSFSVGIKKSLTEVITKSKKHVFAVVRITRPIKEFTYTRGVPRLNDDALEGLDRYGPRFFVENYGSNYVQKNVYGADLVYIYRLDFSSVSENKVKDVIRNFQVGFAPYFSFGTSSSLSSSEIREIQNSITDVTILSNLNGFAPRIVKNEKQAEREMDRLEAYLKSPQGRKENPLLATYTKSYEKVADFNFGEKRRMKGAFVKAAKCHQKLQQWLSEEAKVSFVRKSTLTPSIAAQADNALRTIRVQIEKATNCEQGSRAPRFNEFKSIQLEPELRRAFEL
ncbi:hypothetical protein GCM10009430_31970 [Aquimarina litoralis]|uniref:Uncharacterized protein n=1 Tax=Aquimarina litoralis TaxID=584605 RepID=A0ABP3U731_9FLAO